MTITLGRNDPCHCGSGKKYKKCHLAKDEQAESKRLAKMAFQPKTDPAEAKKGDDAQKSHAPAKGGGWFKNLVSKGGSLFRPPQINRKTGGGG